MTLIDFWSQVWPNLAASVIWATPLFVVHHVRLMTHLDRCRADLKAMHDSMMLNQLKVILGKDDEQWHNPPA